MTIGSCCSSLSCCVSPPPPPQAAATRPTRHSTASNLRTTLSSLALLSLALLDFDQQARQQAGARGNRLNLDELIGPMVEPADGTDAVDGGDACCRGPAPIGHPPRDLRPRDDGRGSSELLVCR